MDPGDIDAIGEAYDPACEWDNTHWEGWPEDDVYYGREGVRQLFEDWHASWESFEAGADEYLGVGGDRVLIVCWQQGFGRGSHVAGSDGLGIALHVAREACPRVESYSDRRAALEAVGLSE